MGTTTTGADVLSISDRDRILRAMAECCAREGYQATTVAAVVQRAGVEPESFESHFAGKEDCALAALNQVVSETLARISMVGAQAAGAAGRRRFEIGAILELMASRPAFAWLGYIESRQGGTPRMHDSYESAVRVLALMMERTSAQRDGPSALARATLGGAEALVRRELAAGRAEGISRLLPDLVYAALVPFVGQREALRQAKLAANASAEEGYGEP